MTIAKKIIIFCIAAVALIFGGIQLYNLFHFNLYSGYKQYLSDYEIEEGSAFVAIADTTVNVEGMTLVAENDKLKLYTNTKTADIAVYDKRTGKTTYTNPPEADMDTLASKTNKAYLKSQLIVEYYNAGKTAGTYDSFSYATELGQIEYEAVDNGIRYIYTIGNFASETGIVPTFISKERFDLFLSQMSQEGIKYVKPKFKERTSGDGFMALMDGAKGQATVRKMNTYFEEAGYTEDDFVQDMIDSGEEDAIPINFVIPVEYRLHDDSLDVSVPTKMIVENGGGKINRIQLLRYFGAADSSESGYILVPNGSGSLIYFNNGRNKVESYSQYVYGIDPMIADYTVVENTEKARLPVFGLQKEGYGIFATIEEGEALASISAGVSGNINSYNYAYTTFLLRNGEKLSMFGATESVVDLPILEKELYAVNIKVRYSFLTDEYDGYSGMANYYRNRLIQEGVLTTQEEMGDIPFYTILK